MKLLYQPLGRESSEFLLEALERPRGECYNPSSEIWLTGIAKDSNNRRKASMVSEKLCSKFLCDQEQGTSSSQEGTTYSSYI